MDMLRGGMYFGVAQCSSRAGLIGSSSIFFFQIPPQLERATAIESVCGILGRNILVLECLLSYL